MYGKKLIEPFKTFFRVPNLLENHTYEFRVAAVNAAGQGSWSQPSDAFVCHSQPFAPKITSDLSIRDLTVMAGEEFCITVPFNANPRPKPFWSVNGEEILGGDRIKFETNDTQTIFRNRSAKRSDTGNYTIQLTNSAGSDTGTCKVLVVDKPSPPLGPLDVSDITPETCSISWRPPADDGGSPITNYVVEKMDPFSGVSFYLFLSRTMLFSWFMYHQRDREIIFVPPPVVLAIVGIFLSVPPRFER